MIACLDVGYGDDEATAACVLIDNWISGAALHECTEIIDEVQDYVPGQFFQRELPCLLAVLEKVCQRPDVIVVDGFVTLSSDGKRGLGAHLFDTVNGEGGNVFADASPHQGVSTDLSPASERPIAVVGVAKKAFAGATHAIEVFRGQSDRPLFVTAAGMEVHQAADCVRRMSGRHRIPTVLKRVDQLSRQNLST